MSELGVLQAAEASAMKAQSASRKRLRRIFAFAVDEP